jgi:hypothetical protein
MMSGAHRLDTGIGASGYILVMNGRWIAVSRSFAARAAVTRGADRSARPAMTSCHHYGLAALQVPAHPSADPFHRPSPPGSTW